MDDDATGTIGALLAHPARVAMSVVDRGVDDPGG